MSMAYKEGLGVEWYFPNKKRKFAESTVATSDLIELLSEQHLTVRDVYNAINYDTDAKEIVNKFIENGYGDFIMYDFIHNNYKHEYRKLTDNQIVTISLEDLEKNLDTKKMGELEYEI